MLPHEAIELAEKFVKSRQDPLLEPETGAIVEDAHYRADAGKLIGKNSDGDWIVQVAFSYVDAEDVLVDQGVINVFIPEDATSEVDYFEHDLVG